MSQLKPEYYRCGICDHLHQWNWDGDCRQNDARFTEEQLDKKHGRFKWHEYTMTDRVKADTEPNPTAEPARKGFRLGGTNVLYGSIDCLIGCNVRGRLLHVETLLSKGLNVGAIQEVKNLLKFFPEPKAKVHRKHSHTKRAP